jgi:hypothetical protein
VLRLRPLAVLLSLALALCLLGLWSVRSQTGALRRVTNTTAEGVNVNPSLSGDGRRISFESTKDLAGAGGNGFHALRADLSSDPATFIQMGVTRAPAPGISQDGSIIAFASKDDPLGTNPDGNSEIFLYSGTTLRQITNTTPSSPTERTRQGNFQPSLTDDGRFIAFSSNRNPAGQNSDANLEIFIFDTSSSAFTQLTNTTGAVGATDAKISGDGTRVAYIRDTNAAPATQRDLMLQDRAGATVRILASNVTNLAFTYGRAISDDGLRIVYSGDIAPNSSQVFLFDGRTTNATRQITALGEREVEVPLHPTISGDGTRIAFAARRHLDVLPADTDTSIDLYTYDIPTGQFARVTDAPSTADGFDGSLRAAEVVSSLSDDGSIVAFNFPRALSDDVDSQFDNNSEIYVTGTAARPTVGSLTIFNEASFGHELSTPKAISPDSRAVALGGALAFTTRQAPRETESSFPTSLDGTTVTVNGRRAQIFYISPTEVRFHVPAETELGTAEVVVTNSEGFQSRGTVTVFRASPGIFTKTGDGLGDAVVLNANMMGSETFDPSDGQLRLIIFTTGVRNATQVSVTAGGRALTVEAVSRTPNMPGMDEVRVLVPADLRGAGRVNLVVRADNRDSNPASIVFAGNACFNIVINEVLADPPDAPGGDANRDLTRSGSDDEFVELVNPTDTNRDISGYQLLTRSSTSSTDTVRFTFPAGTLFPAKSAIVVFGGGAPDASNPAFGGAQIFVATSSAGLSLTNSGGVVTLREPSLAIVSIFSYGGSTGLNGDANQSLTRAPDAGVSDVCGNFTLHTTAPGGNGQPYSPGTQINGAPFARGTGQLTSITVSPPSASVGVGQTTQFTAQARDQFSRPVTNATITFASDNTAVATVDGVVIDPTTGIATATVTGRSVGTAHITAQATDGTTTVTSNQATLTVNAQANTYTITGQVRDNNNNPVSGVLITFEKNFQGTLSTATTQTDANGNYSSGDLGCQNSVKVTPSKTGLTFSPTSITFVNSSQCLTGTETANFTAAPPPPGTLVISQLYVAGGNAGATYTNDFVEIFNSGTTTVDFSVTPYSVQFSGIGASAWAKTDINAGTIAPGQYFLVREASGGAVGAALPAADATGTINLLSAGGKVALVIGTTVLPAFTCPGDDGATPFNPANLSIADFVGYGSNANTAGHCYEGPGPAPAPTSTNADFRKAGGCVDTNFNADDFLVASPNPRNTASPLNNCSSGIRPDITINNATVTEGNSGTINATFTVTLSAPAASNVTVDFATADGTATAGSDYQATSGTLTFTPGQTTQTINVAVIGDTTDEPNETFFVNLTNATNAVLLDSQGLGTITDNDSAPTISINDVTVTEGDTGTTTAAFNVSLSAASGLSVTVNYATADGTATAVSDYQATSGTLTFTPGQTTQTVNVLVNGDTIFEPNETFFVNLTTPVNATITDNQGQGTITNDDAAPPVPALSIDDVSIAEGDSGTKTATFTVSLSMNPTETVTVDYATANGTATAGSDYQSTAGTLTFNPGETTKTITVTINGDTLVEPNETFFVNLSNQSAGAIISDAQGVGTITNDDAANLVISQVYGGGNNSGALYQRDFIEIFNRGTTTVDFSVTNYSVQYASAGANFGSSKTDLTTGSIAPGHYFLIQEAGGTTNGAPLPTPDATGTIAMGNTSGKVALVAGTTSLTAAICPGDDGVAPFNPNDATIADFIGYGSVVCYEGSGPAPAPSNTTADFRKAGGCVDTNDNAADFLVASPNPRNTASPVNDCSAGIKPEITINDVSVSESTANATFTVTLSAASALTVTVDYATADGTATAGTDYQSTSGTLTFAPGETTKTILVPLINDTMDEPSETFFVNLTNATNGTILDNQGQGTITDNDNPPTLSINDVSVAEGDAGTTSADFTVTLSAASAFTVTVNYATADNTATAGSDYQAATSTLTFNPGETTKTVSVLVNGDTTFEQNETFFVDLSGAANATILDGQGQGTITNDDAAPPTPALSITDASVTEGNAGTKTVDFTVSLSPVSTGTVTVDYATADGTATAPSDYQSTSGTLTFNPGETTKTITVTINGDTLVEPNETFFVNLSNQSAGVIVSDAQGVGTITNDDTADLVISQVYGGGGNTGAPYTNDFVEIFNQGATTVDFSVTPYSIQYASASSGGTFSSSNKTNLTTGTIAPGGYFLVQEASGGAVGVALPTPDASGSIILAATTGKVALVVGVGVLPAFTCPGDDGTSPFNPSDSIIADFVGYGGSATTTGHCYEGTGPAPAPSATTADFRKAGGCLDTDQNATDFLVSAPAPRNTLSPTNDCSAGLKPEITINDRALSESTTPATFTVTLSTTSTLTVTVDYSTANGTATAGADYTAVSGTLTFNPGETTKTIDVPVTNDALDEANETYFVNLSNASNGIILDAQGQGTINDNDNAPTLSINDASVTEGDSGTKTLDFTVTLSTASGQTVTVDYATADGTATAGSDYQSASATLTFNPGDTTKTISVTINGDTTVEPNETFFVNLTTPVNATITDNQGQGTITNDDVTPSISITDVTLNEGNAGTTAFTFTVTLSPSSTQTVTVDYQTADGTATAPGDYTGLSSTQLSFAPGETSKQVTVQVNGDTDAEGNETFFVNLSNPTNATIGDNQGVGTITNDDAAATSADLSVTKTDSPDPVAIGNDITYTITVNNGGPDPASSAVLTDTVPTNTTFRSITTPAGWTCGTIPAVGATGSISCTNPSFAAGASSVFTLIVRVNTTATDGTIISNTASISSSTSDSNGTNNSATQQTTVKQPLLVISQVYGGGGLTGATYRNDFIEIFNRGTTTVDFSVTPYSVQYAGAANSFTTLKTDITSGTIAPGQYFLIQEASGGATGSLLPTPDATGTINLNANSGKVALVLGTTALSGTCPGDDGVAPFNPAGSGVVDFLGYGFGSSTDNPNCFEGAARATTASATANARSIMRTISCTDTNNNSADFTYTNSTGTSPPVARNKLTPTAACPP